VRRRRSRRRILVYSWKFGNGTQFSPKQWGEIADGRHFYLATLNIWSQKGIEVDRNMLRCECELA
jgi:hypothetical protein